MTFTGHVLDGKVVFDMPVPLPNGALVQVSPVEPVGSPSTHDLMLLAEQSGVLDFWKDDVEDIYSLGDGEPL